MIAPSVAQTREARGAAAPNSSAPTANAATPLPVESTSDRNTPATSKAAKDNRNAQWQKTWKYVPPPPPRDVGHERGSHQVGEEPGEVTGVSRHPAKKERIRLPGIARLVRNAAVRNASSLSIASTPFEQFPQIHFAKGALLLQPPSVRRPRRVPIPFSTVNRNGRHSIRLFNQSSSIPK